jgi:hypothetical protein
VRGNEEEKEVREKLERRERNLGRWQESGGDENWNHRSEDSKKWDVGTGNVIELKGNVDIDYKEIEGGRVKMKNSYVWTQRKTDKVQF